MKAPASLGDLLDRITILQIKTERLRNEGQRASVYRELNALLESWHAEFPKAETVPEYDALRKVNEALWDVEDQLRAMEAAQDFGTTFVELARSVYKTNDQRAALKRKVNQRFGSVLMEEKQHPDYHAPAPAPAPALAPAPVLTHIDAAGNAQMVDVGAKAVTQRSARATGKVFLGPEARQQIQSRTAKKGDVLGVAQIAGIQAAKRTGELIPLCHPLPLDAISVLLELQSDHVLITATVRCTGRTGVEMEALTAVSVAALTVYDMLKAVDRGISISAVQLIEKTGGRSGTWSAS